MEALYIPRLGKLLERSQTISFREFLPELDTLTPVQGTVTVHHRGNYLEVTATAESITTLSCNRCLQHYNHRICVDASEIIWLTELPEAIDTLPLDQELAVDELVETLPHDGYLDVQQWLYEQLCLAIPQRQLCDAECPGIEFANPEEPVFSIDQRWANLECLKGQFPS